MKYGLNYQGSKNPIVAELCALFPTKTNFYDLFAGGCAVSHRMLEIGGFQRYFISDVNALPITLFADCLCGDVPEPKWVSREDFEALRYDNGYVACCYSFGGDWSSYLYAKDREEEQRQLHENIIKDADYHTWHLRRIAALAMDKRAVELERMEQLVAISKIKRPRCNIFFGNKSYDEEKVLPDSVIYCDPPYKDTKGYVAKGFDHDKFYDWCRAQDELVFISEYAMPSDFVCIHEFTRLEAKSAYKSSNVIERLFIPKHQLDLYHEHKTTLF